MEKVFLAFYKQIFSSAALEVTYSMKEVPAESISYKLVQDFYLKVLLNDI